MRKALVALLAAAVVGCGSGGSDASSAQDAATPAATTEAPAQTPAAEATEEAQATQRRGVRLQRVGMFDAPLYVTAPPGDERRVHVVEQGGRVWVIRGGRRLSQPFLDLRSQVTAGGEQGLLSLAFAPDFDSSRRFYVMYTDRNGNTRVVEYAAHSPDRADPASARLVLFQRDPEPNHNGGLLLFGPDDLLYVGMGDGGGGGDQHGARGNGQSLSTLLGKILRIDPRPDRGRQYTIPDSNPLVGRRGARGEIYAYGLRNPWRFSFDRESGDLSIADVGQNAVEEVSFVRSGDGAGANFGWRPYEGNDVYAPGESAPGHIRPVITRTHGAGWCSITGGVVVRDPELPALFGRYVFGDYCEDRIYSAVLRRPRARDVRAHANLPIQSLSSFGEDARGRVYATSLSGPVYRLAAQ